MQLEKERERESLKQKDEITLLAEDLLPSVPVRDTTFTTYLLSSSFTSLVTLPLTPPATPSTQFYLTLSISALLAMLPFSPIHFSSSA